MKAKIFLLFFLSLFFRENKLSAIENESLIDNNTIVSSQISNLNVKTFCQDSLGYMWIATPRGLNRYNGYEFVQYFHDKNDSTSINNDFVFSLFLDSSHRLWIGTNTGVDRYDFVTSQFHHYNYSSPISVRSFFEDTHGKIWVATHSGIASIDMNNQSIEMKGEPSFSVSMMWMDGSNRLWGGTSDGLTYSNDGSTWEQITLPGSRSVTCMAADPQGLCWLGTDSGILLFDPISQTIRPIPDVLEKNRLLQSSYIHFIKEIDPLIFLIGTSSQGVFLYNMLDQTLAHNPPRYVNDFHSEQLISCYIDRQNNIWLGSFDKGFSIINLNQRFFNLDRKLSNIFENKFVTNITEDTYHNYWIGTRYDGLFWYSPNGKLVVYNSENSELFKDNNNLVEMLFVDSKKRLWIGLHKSLVVASFTSEGKISVLANQIVSESGLGSGSITEDKEGNIWIGVSSGLYLLENDKQPTQIRRIYEKNIPAVCALISGEILFSVYREGVFRWDKDSFSPQSMEFPSEEALTVAKYCVNMFEDSKKRLWLGSYGKGALSISSEDEYTIFTSKNGLPSNDITCILEDPQRDIWMSTSNGLARMKPDYTFSNYFSYDGTLGDQYHEKAGMVASDGQIFFGGNHGLTFFYPLTILPNKHLPLVHLEDLKILNQSINPQTKGSVLTKSIAFTDKIILNNKHTIFSIDYSGIDFLAPQKITYAYKLEGFDSDWNHVGNHRRATYSNLKPGDYTFRVKAWNNDGFESQDPVALQIIVKPVIWKTWQAWMIYLLLITLLVIYLVKRWTKKTLQNQTLQIAQKEKEREKDITNMGNIDTQSADLEEHASAIIKKEDTERKNEPPYTILIAEDNVESMVLLKGILKDQYDLIETTNGEEALKAIHQESPDLILSDVLMPKLSGYELCSQVKQHPELSHIPVVLITAKNTVDDQIEGLKKGAEAYICKPFDVEYLQLVIKNILANRNKLKGDYFTPQIEKPLDTPVKLNDLDQRFIERLMELFEKELSNSDLNIDEIAKELAFSRTSFYRKLKGLTGMSPAHFLRNYRLKRAAELISEGSLNLYEVAENTGFGTYTYFSVTFKKHFGVSPKEYRSNANNP